MQTQQIACRPESQRGQTNFSWLQSKHSFSFGHYRDPANTHFGSLRVINDDIVAPGEGFSRHPHANMEIMTWVLSGALKHGDSIGNMQVLRPGELQVMTAGTGIEHSEMNASDTEPVHFLQIWISPREKNIEPNYAQRSFDASARANQWDTLASGLGHASALPIQQDAQLRVADVRAGTTIRAKVDIAHHAYIHVATGSGVAAGYELIAGDALTIEGPDDVEFAAKADMQLMWFDLS